VTPNSALIIAPHPDDETFGTGGLIATKVAIGAPVSVLFLTGGGASHRVCCDISPEILIEGRLATARRALSVLGDDSICCTCLGLEDGLVPHRGEPGFERAVASIAEAIQWSGATDVFVTHPAEPWSDHLAAAQMTIEACARLRPRCLWFYLVWTPLNQPLYQLLRLDWRHARQLSLDAQIETKQSAISTYLEAMPHNSCAHPLVGALPRDFLRIHESARELYFLAI
jgi:LmbE family N-acetylglucosaminyl deacetylase